MGTELGLDIFDELPRRLKIDVPPGVHYRLRLFPKLPFKESAVQVHVGENGVFEAVSADVIPHSGRFSMNVFLDGRNAVAHWFLSSIAYDGDNKNFEPSVYHLHSETSSLFESYGVSTGKSTLSFSGVSQIEKGAMKSKTRQAAKIIVFDEKGDGKSSPILRIGDNDVEASHAAVVGRLNEEHLYYLESRGLSREMARRLIALGYVLPVGKYFEEAEKDIIVRKVEEGLFDA